jgi:transcriptional regulator with PAS, ATPase and Fis domain
MAPSQSKERIELLLRQVNELPDDYEKVSPKATSPPIHDVESGSGIVTHSPVMREAVTLAERVSGVDLTVLITRESGTGKERIARFIHARSARASQPFVAINCGAINENLLESELFGHARGSFTGAVQSRAGIFEAANHGTLLLDEIGEISLGMQVKLLRVLQEHEVRRVGESKTRPIDVRLLVSTNCDLDTQTELGTFREDLYYRIHVVEVVVPPLRQRREDILPLARALLEQASHRLKRQIIGFSPAVADQLLRHTWPGNVRELENALERAVALAPGSRIELSDLPPQVLRELAQSPEKLDSVRPLQDIAKDYIVAALELNGGNQTHAAKQLGIGTATLYRKLKSYGYRVADLDATDQDLVATFLDPG